MTKASKLLTSGAVLVLLAACGHTSIGDTGRYDDGVYLQADVNQDYRSVYDCLVTRLQRTWRYKALHADQGYGELASMNAANPSYYWMKFNVYHSGEGKARVEGVLTPSTYALLWEARDKTSADVCVAAPDWRMVKRLPPRR